MAKRDDLISWLNDAHALELSVMEVLKNHVKDAEKYPEIKSHLQQHLAQTRHHAQKIKNCIEAEGGTVSTSKAVIGDMLGRMQAMSMEMYRDELVKDFLAECAAEHLEIACYKSLIAGAEEAGRPEVARVCREILEEEKAMAQWVEDQIPMVTKNYLREQAPRAVGSM